MWSEEVNQAIQPVEGFMLVKLGTGVLNLWPILLIAGREFGPPHPGEGRLDGAPNEPYREDVIIQSKCGPTQFANVTQRGFWEFQSLTLVGILK